MLTTAPCSGVRPSLMGWLSDGTSHLTGWSGLATENVGAALPPLALDFEHASRKAAMDGSATAAPADLSMKPRRLIGRPRRGVGALWWGTTVSSRAAGRTDRAGRRGTLRPPT